MGSLAPVRDHWRRASAIGSVGVGVGRHGMLVASLTQGSRYCNYRDYDDYRQGHARPDGAAAMSGLGAVDARAARDPRSRACRGARADRPSRGGDRRVARVSLGRRRAVPRARLLRALLLRRRTAAPARARCSRSSRSRRSRGSARRSGLILAVQELGLARHQARRLGGAARGVAAAARLGRGAAPRTR